MKNLKSSAILIIMLSAIAGCLINYVIISSNLKQPKPDSLVIKSFPDTVDFKLKAVNPDSVMTVVKDSVRVVSIPPDKILFHSNPIFLVWVSLILIMMSIGWGAFPVFVWQLIRLKKDFHLDDWEVPRALLYSIILFAFMGGLQYTLPGYYSPDKVIEHFKILFYHCNVLHIIVFQSFVLQIPMVMVMFTVPAASDKVNMEFRIHDELTREDDDLKGETEPKKKRDEVKRKTEIELAVSSLQNLNQILSSSLQMLAVVVVFSVLTSSALRESIVSALYIPKFKIFPSEVSYSYGLFFSLFLGIVYFPAFTYLKLQFARLKKEIAGRRNDKISEGAKDWSVEILSTLENKTSALDNLKLALTVISPLLTSFLPEQLHLFK